MRMILEGRPLEGDTQRPKRSRRGSQSGTTFFLLRLPFEIDPHSDRCPTEILAISLPSAMLVPCGWLDEQKGSDRGLQVTSKWIRD